MLKISGYIQARMGSSRLPGKVMKEIEGIPLVGHIIDRLKQVDGLDSVVLGTTAASNNNSLVKYAKNCGVLVHREAEENELLGRMMGALNLSGSDALLKINADCPIPDVGLMRQMVAFAKNNPEYEYVANKINFSYPLVFSLEIIKKSALLWCSENLITADEREYFANFIKLSPEKFEQFSFVYGENLSEYDLSVDTIEDFNVMVALFKQFYKKNNYFGIEKVVQFLKLTQHEEITNE